MRNILRKDFFNKPVLEVAEGLLGKFLIRKVNGEEIALMLTEVEAYDGIEDKACHAYRGKTQRTAVMFGPPGCFYIYLIYGMYWMLNIVTEKEGYPSAVLIRGTREVCGPGRLTKKLCIDKSLNGKVSGIYQGLWVEDRGIKILKKDIKRTPRIGVLYAGPVWSKKLYRFVLNGGY
jgi:DNA-3-methyladenine glycosylase